MTRPQVYRGLFAVAIGTAVFVFLLDNPKTGGLAHFFDYWLNAVVGVAMYALFAVLVFWLFSRPWSKIH